MPDFTLRKTMLFIEDIHHDGGPPPAKPRRRAAIIALVRNPFAGGYTDDLQSAMDDLKPLGLALTDRLIAAMDGIDGIDGYGKAAMAGENGELEHTALWHVPGGYAMRARLGDAKAIVPSCMKLGGRAHPQPYGRAGGGRCERRGWVTITHPTSRHHWSAWCAARARRLTSMATPNASAAIIIPMPSRAVSASIQTGLRHQPGTSGQNHQTPTTAKTKVAASTICAPRPPKTCGANAATPQKTAANP